MNAFLLLIVRQRGTKTAAESRHVRRLQHGAADAAFRPRAPM